jgi:hypothetical protein
MERVCSKYAGIEKYRNYQQPKVGWDSFPKKEEESSKFKNTFPIHT